VYGHLEWLDILVVLGKYEHGQISFPGLGFDYKYNSGTIVAFPRKIFHHRTKCEGDQACIAFYMQDNVLDWLQLPTGNWLNVSQY